MGVSKNRGTPKWMVYNGNPIKMGDLGGPPLFLETPIYSALKPVEKSKISAQSASRLRSSVRIELLPDAIPKEDLVVLNAALPPTQHILSSMT